LSVIKPLKTMPVGVVVQRTRAASQWVDYLWRPLSVLPGVPETEPWTKLSDNGDVATFYVGAAELEFYPSDTTQYRDNLMSKSPSLWVTLRPTGAEPPYQLWSVTADTAEGEAMTETGHDLVETVPMPDEVADVVAQFVTEHHIERLFYKRKRKDTDPESLARRAPGGKDRR
jgi:hypothetical protein